LWQDSYTPLKTYRVTHLVLDFYNLLIRISLLFFTIKKPLLGDSSNERGKYHSSRTEGGFQVPQYANLQKMVNTPSEGFDLQGLINKALIGILISKGIITEEEVLVILGNINRQQEVFSKKQNRT